MKAYEIIKEIRSSCSVNPLEVLNTLSSEVERLRAYYSESLNGARCWSLIDLIDNLLSMPLTLSMFVPYKDGKPLEFFNSDCSVNKQLQCCVDVEPCECDSLTKRQNKAKKAVLFEGWAVRHIGDTRLIVVNGRMSITFYTDSPQPQVSISTDNFYSNPIATIADLAAATIEKPLKFK